MMTRTLPHKKIDLKLHLCAVTMLLLQFGEQIKIAGVPLYCFFLLIDLCMMIKERSYKIVLPKFLSIDDIGQFAVFWGLVASALLPFSMRKVGMQPYLYCLATALVIFVINDCAKTETELDYLFYYAVIGLLIACIFSTFELVTGTHFIKMDAYYQRMGNNNAFGFQVNVNDNASLIAVGLFAPIYFWKRKPFMSTIIIFWAVGLLAMIGSRMALLSVLLIPFETILLKMVGKLTSQNRVIIKIISIVTIVVALILIFGVFNTESFLKLISDNENYAYDAARLQFMENAIKTITGFSVLFGNGSGVTVFNIGKSVHCVFLEILCDNGVFVFIWLMSLMGRQLFAFAEDIKTSRMLFVTEFLITFTLIGFCSSSMLRIRPIWMMWALVWKYYKLALPKKNMSNDDFTKR